VELDVFEAHSVQQVQRLQRPAVSAQLKGVCGQLRVRQRRRGTTRVRTESSCLCRRGLTIQARRARARSGTGIGRSSVSATKGPDRQQRKAAGPKHRHERNAQGASRS
jgi:hypothetical protein